MQCIQACRGLAHLTQSEPTVVGHLIGLAFSRAANQMISVSLRHDQLSDSQMNELIAEIENFSELHLRFQLAMNGERAFSLPFFSDPQASMEFSGKEMSGAYMKTRAKDALYYLDQMDQCINAPDSNPREFRDSVAQTMNEFDLPASQGVSEMYHQFERMMSNLLMPAANAIANALVSQLEHNRLATLAMQVQKYRHQFGRWPSELNTLNEIDVDPITLAPVNGGEFGFRIDADDQAVLWGISRSHENAIPNEPPAIDGSENQDWVWQLRD